MRFLPEALQERGCWLLTRKDGPVCPGGCSLCLQKGTWDLVP